MVRTVGAVPNEKEGLEQPRSPAIRGRPEEREKDVSRVANPPVV